LGEYLPFSPPGLFHPAYDVQPLLGAHARGPVESWDGRSFEAVDLQGKVGNKLLPWWFFR